MKIYHTETQEDYDALMGELEEQGCKWLSERKPTEAKYHWFCYEEKTCVRVSFGILTKFDFRHYEEEYPNVPIIKYKAKADEKMKFTKENVEKAIDEYFQEADFESCGDLIAEIHNLDDTPEKVAVPKYVAEWIESKKYSNIYKMVDDLRNGSRLEELILIWLGIEYSKYGLSDKLDLLSLIKIHGYTIEPEQLYYIPLPHLETSDGLQQVLSKRENGENYFACRPNDKLKQRFTKEELAQVPEVYKFYATLIEEEEE